MIAAARLAAYEALRAVSSGRSDLAAALAHVRGRLPDERDRALAGEIATGTLRWQGAFDTIIEAFARRPIAKLDAEVVDILRLTAFQLLYLDRIPAAAAVNDAVALTGKAGKRSASGLVNALLRRISRERDRLPLPSRSSPADYLEKALSHPRWLAVRWLERYGFEAAERWEQFNNAPASLTLRANTLRVTRDSLAQVLLSHGVTTEPTRFAPHGLIVRQGNPLLTPMADEGNFFVQDESSQLVAELTAATADERILDACASPGGKTTAMAAAMGNDGVIVATDLRGRRVDLLRQTIERAGATRAHVVQADASAPLPFCGVFDAVLLDAPCSGLGTLRRDPDIRWRRTEEDLPRFAALQRRMLDRAGDVLSQGGRVIYATCSSEPEENEHVVADFLASHPEFVNGSERIPSSLSQFITSDGYFRTLPFRDELEAFFGAILVKTRETAGAKPRESTT